MNLNGIKLLKQHTAYLNALISGYLLMGTNLVMQFLLTPFYLKHLGEYQFGVLMVLLNLVNFAAIGIGWMSGGYVRIVGEYWAREDIEGIRTAFNVGKYVYSIYALIVVSLALVCWGMGQAVSSKGTVLFHTALMAGLYFILHYEALPERQAFVGINNQTLGNCVELIRVLLFGCSAFFLLPWLGNLDAVWLALITGVAAQRIISGWYWAKHVGGIGWKRFSPDMMPVLKRLAGRQGIGYVAYGVLILILQADTMLIGFIGGAEAAGRFVLLWKIPEAIGLLLWRIPSTMEPEVIALDASAQIAPLRNIFVKGRRWFCLVVLIISMVYMAAGQWVTRLWVGDYAPEADWMYIAGGAALFFNTFARWPISFAYALIRLRSLVKVALIEVVGKLIFMLLLFPRLDIAAPLIASVIIHTVYVGWAYQLMLRDLAKAPTNEPPGTDQNTG